MQMTGRRRERSKKKGKLSKSLSMQSVSGSLGAGMHCRSVRTLNCFALLAGTLARHSTQSQKRPAVGWGLCGAGEVDQPAQSHSNAALSGRVGGQRGEMGRAWAAGWWTSAGPWRDERPPATAAATRRRAGAPAASAASSPTAAARCIVQPAASARRGAPATSGARILPLATFASAF